MVNFKELVLEQMSTPEHAASVAGFRHRRQRRKFTDEPYIVHPNRVARTVSKFTKDKNIIAAAHLHDTIEDTDATYEELEATFGPDVTSLVRELTKNDKEIEKRGKKEYYLRAMNKMTPRALLIKLADRLDNLKDLNIVPAKFRTRYTEETLYIIDNLKRPLTNEHKALIKQIRVKLTPGK